MVFIVEMQNTGDLANRSEIVASIEHALCEEPSDWRISIIGSRGSDDGRQRLRDLAASSEGTLSLTARVNTNRKQSARCW